jgi:hypothetical protein
MSAPHSPWPPGLAVLALAAAVALFADRGAPAPAADVGRGSEEAFASGLQLREIPPGGAPLRWTGERAEIRFRDVPAGAATLEVAVRGQQHAVLVSLDGVVVGSIGVGQSSTAASLAFARRGDHTVELRVEPFRAGDGRTLGAQLQRVRLAPSPARAPSPRVLLLFAGPALAVFAAVLLCGLGVPLATGAGLYVALLQVLLLWPQGLLRSPYAATLALLLAGLGAAAALFARLCARRVPGAGGWALAAAGAALTVQGLLATSPLLVVSDAVFHANNLLRVAGGDLLPTSVTQHATPFRFPYGVSFYLVLAPFLRLCGDPVALVRGGAAVSAVASSLALFLMLLRRRSPDQAGLAVVMLVLLPVTLDVHSHGNLSNVFGQALTTAFFAWWAGGTPGGWAAGALLLAVGATGHFSSLVVLGVLALALLALARRDAGRAQVIGSAVGLALAGAYYLQFAPLVLRQLPRLREGGGQGRGGSRGALGVLRLQAWGVVGQWGPGALALAVMGHPRRTGDALDRDLRAAWLAGAALALLAVVSPLEVRYLYALTVPLAVAAGAGALRLTRKGLGGRLVAGLLVLAQAAQAWANAADALLRRYR